MAIRILPHNSGEQLSKHINARELRCKCGGAHSITVSTELIDKTEMILSIVAKANGDTDDVHIQISSANRCKQHDKNVGGSGWGMHTVGKALDFMVTCNGKMVDSRDVACIAQEIGFTGIGRINASYIHCDVGTLAEHGGKKWLGDETVKGGTSGSVINEPKTYWLYYGINRSKYFPVVEKSIENRLQEALNTLGESLTVDGVIGTKSVAALKNHPIKQGDSGEYIKVMQEYLASKGYNCGSADGIAGAKTVTAIYNAAIDRLFA